MKKEGQETNKLHTNLLVSRSSTEKDFSRSLFLRKKKKKKTRKEKRERREDKYKCDELL